MLQGIHHVSINVDDVDTATHFYVAVLGMQLLPRPDLGFPGAWLQSGNQEVHLLDIQSGRPPQEQHFAFLVDNIDSVAAQLDAHAIAHTTAKEITGVCRQMFTHDPSGNMIEFNQRLN